MQIGRENRQFSEFCERWMIDLDFGFKDLNESEIYPIKQEPLLNSLRISVTDGDMSSNFCFPCETLDVAHSAACS